MLILLLDLHEPSKNDKADQNISQTPTSLKFISPPTQTSIADTLELQEENEPSRNDRAEQNIFQTQTTLEFLSPPT